MARITEDRVRARVLGVDDNGNSLPVGIWGTVHNLDPTEGAHARNSTPFGESVGVVSIIAIGGPGHFKQGSNSVTATPDDVYLPEGVWLDLLIPKGSNWDYVSVISASGAGPIAVQVVERNL